MARPCRSTNTAQLAAALAHVQAKLKSAEKSSVNPHLKNKYADLESIWNALQPLLGQQGIAVTQGGAVTGGDVVLVTTLMLGDEWIESRIPVRPETQKGLNAAQSFGVAWSYTRRYALAAICGVQTGEDTDGATDKPSVPRGAPPDIPEDENPPEKNKAPYYRYLERCQQLKKSLDDDEAYYEILAGFKLNKSNQTKDVNVMSDVVVALQEAVVALVAAHIVNAEKRRRMSKATIETKRRELLTDWKSLHKNSELSLRKYLASIGGE